MDKAKLIKITDQLAKDIRTGCNNGDEMMTVLGTLVSSSIHFKMLESIASLVSKNPDIPKSTVIKCASELTVKITEILIKSISDAQCNQAINFLEDSWPIVEKMVQKMREQQN